MSLPLLSVHDGRDGFCIGLHVGTILVNRQVAHVQEEQVFGFLRIPHSPAFASYGIVAPTPCVSEDDDFLHAVEKVIGMVVVSGDFGPTGVKQRRVTQDIFIHFPSFDGPRRVAPCSWSAEWDRRGTQNAQPVGWIWNFYGITPCHSTGGALDSREMRSKLLVPEWK